MTTTGLGFLGGRTTHPNYIATMTITGSGSVFKGGSTTQIYGKAWVVEDHFCLPRHAEARDISMVKIPAPGYPWLMVECYVVRDLMF